MADENIDGEIFLEKGGEPPVYDIEDHEDEFETVVLEDATSFAELSSNGIFEKTLAKWRDPTSPPHIKKKCAKWIRTGFPPMKICVGWTLKYRWIYRTAILRVRAPGQDDIDAIVHDCLKKSAVAAVIAGVASGGAAALKAAEAALLTCLKSELSDAEIEVSIRMKTIRGPWE
tara:strand:- start:730 stop:1248 length:519 start_codon:yes stop_codon:yes gene_type:complete